MMSWPGLLFRPFFQISHQSCSGLVLGLEDFSLQFQSLGYLWESSSSKFPWLSLREKCTFNSFFGILLSSLSVFCQNQRRAPTVECEQHKRGRFVPLQGAPCCYTSITFKKKMLHMAQWTARFRWLLCFSIVSCSLFALTHSVFLYAEGRKCSCQYQGCVGGLETCIWVLGETLNATNITNGHLKSELLPDLHLEHFLLLSLQPCILCSFFDPCRAASGTENIQWFCRGMTVNIRTGAAAPASLSLTLAKTQAVTHTSKGYWQRESR